jgi:hypothetical protein
VKALETELDRLDEEITTLEKRARTGQLDVARALREVESALAAWREILRGDPVRACEALRKLVLGPILMEPLPEIHGYRWRGELNGGAVLEGAQKYPWCRGPVPSILRTSKTGAAAQRNTGRCNLCRLSKFPEDPVPFPGLPRAPAGGGGASGSPAPLLVAIISG